MFLDFKKWVKQYKPWVIMGQQDDAYVNLFLPSSLLPKVSQQSGKHPMNLFHPTHKLPQQYFQHNYHNGVDMNKN